MTQSIEEARRLVEASSPWRPAPEWAARMVEAPEAAPTRDLVEAFVEVGLDEVHATRLAGQFTGGMFESFTDALGHRSPWERSRVAVDAVRVGEMGRRLGEVSPERVVGRLGVLLRERFSEPDSAGHAVSVLKVDRARGVVRFKGRIWPATWSHEYEHQFEVAAGGAVSLTGVPRFCEVGPL